MKYLSSTPFSSPPTSDAYRKNYPFGPSKFERELALEELMERAKTVTMTEEQKEEQRRSFAFGNTALSNSDITRELVDEVAEQMKK